MGPKWSEIAIHTLNPNLMLLSLRVSSYSFHSPLSEPDSNGAANTSLRNLHFTLTSLSLPPHLWSPLELVPPFSSVGVLIPTQPECTECGSWPLSLPFCASSVPITMHLRLWDASLSCSLG